MPIHIAITLRVRPERETEFQQAVRELFQDSFNCDSVLGANMLIPPPNSSTREYGILRTFTNEAERDAFYASPMFKAFEERAKTMTEGEAMYRPLNGLEAWFRSSPNPPPRWKMAVATLLCVYPTSLFLLLTISKITQSWPLPLGALTFGACMVVLLTWVVMPLITRLLRHWLNSQSHPMKKLHELQNNS